ncbi:hypothetical protein [Cryobacterium sp. SO1]|uniref:hypothetical protein n=1 Tax=Cryobacterium sp. SO1 TaxID=1897061 RepID=UPI0010DFF31C|nr:hypothetical protein [Cryobacterium sp. SO1]RZI37559.1 hypothetical protein BJQ95_00034 [Cryobacterium sp. SO1]
MTDGIETEQGCQGMQYFVSMFNAQAQLHHVDNDGDGDHTWTAVRDVRAAHSDSWAFAHVNRYSRELPKHR